MADPTIAKTVVADINAGTDADWRAAFKVDGESFPWLLSEEGPTARKVSDDLYLVRVTILVVSLAGEGMPETFVHEWENADLNIGWGQPTIQGIKFPWLISEDGILYRSPGSTDIPTVELEFFAEHVEGMEVIDGVSPEDGKVRSAEGRVIHRAEVADVLSGASASVSQLSQAVSKLQAEG